MENLRSIVFEEPFPHLIVEDFYNDTELELIWEELDFYTKDGKLFDAKDYGGIVDKTNSKAIQLDHLYAGDYRKISNILTVNRKVFDGNILDTFSDIHDCCDIARWCNHDITKVRYYHDGDFYEPHTDRCMQFLGFSYFYREPKKFQGGHLIFPKYNYEIECKNNSIIYMPGWVEHGVSEVQISNSDYLEGYGRYAITSFFGNIEKRKETE